jgi:predicted DNA-binding transcriptional regulator AlpA
VKAGEIERVKIGRRVGYVESSVSAYIQRLREKAQVAA